MNLLRKAAEFEQLCAKLAKQAQNANQSFRFNTPIPDASLSGPTPQFRVFKTPEEAHQEALNSLPAVDVHDLPEAPSVKSAPQAKLPMEMLGIFSKTLMNFDPAQFNGVSVDVEALKAAGNKLNTAVSNKQAPEILKALTEVLGLTRNGGGQLYNMAYKLYNAVKATQVKQPAQWLTQYMNQQKLMEQGEAMKNQMQAALNMPSAVQNALDRSK